MSDIHEPDLDRAFAALTSDLTTCSSGPGAPAAVATARKRRRTRVGAVAVIAAVVVAGFATPSVIGETRDDSIAGSQPLPTPAPLSEGSLNRATQGWTGAWQEVNEANSAALDDISTPCLDQFEAPQVQGERSGSRMFIADDGAIAASAFMDYSNDPTAAAQMASSVSESAESCGAHVTQSTYGDVTLTHGSAAGTADQDVFDVWVARVGDRIASMIIAGPAATPPPDATQAITEVFLAAVQDESSYETTSDLVGSTQPKGLQELPTRGYAHLSLDQIREATGAWSQDWARRSSSKAITLPCISGSWPASRPFNGGSAIGDRGTLTFAFTGDPVHEVDKILTSLADCDAAQWTTHHVDRTPYDAGWASYDGGSVFLAVTGSTVVSLRVRELEVPSEEVVTRMIGLLEQSYAPPASPSGAP